MDVRRDEQILVEVVTARCASLAIIAPEYRVPMRDHPTEFSKLCELRAIPWVASDPHGESTRVQSYGVQRSLNASQCIPVASGDSHRREFVCTRPMYRVPADSRRRCAHLIVHRCDCARMPITTETEHGYRSGISELTCECGIVEKTSDCRSARIHIARWHEDAVTAI